MMVLKFQGQLAQLPAPLRKLAHVWEHMYWLAKTNKICAGTLSPAERSDARDLLDI